MPDIRKGKKKKKEKKTRKKEKKRRLVSLGIIPYQRRLLFLQISISTCNFWAATPVLSSAPARPVKGCLRTVCGLGTPDTAAPSSTLHVRPVVKAGRLLIQTALSLFCRGAALRWRLCWGRNNLGLIQRPETPWLIQTSPGLEAVSERVGINILAVSSVPAATQNR